MKMSIFLYPVPVQAIPSGLLSDVVDFIEEDDTLMIQLGLMLLR